jgi:VIT1/CCC1 family predicted Fe2+/Mn2+ transporter
MNSKKNNQKIDHFPAWKREEYIRHAEVLEAQVQYLNAQSLKMQVQLIIIRQRFLKNKEEYVRHISELKAQIQHLNQQRLNELQQQEKYTLSIELLKTQVQELNWQLEAANERTVSAQGLAMDCAVERQMKHEPSLQSSTYIVPNRNRSTWLDQFIAFVPFLTLMVSCIVGLTAAFILAVPYSLVMIPSLGGMVSFTFSLLVRVLFLMIVGSIIVSFVLEIFRNRTH